MKAEHTPGPYAVQYDGNDLPIYIYSVQTTQWICTLLPLIPKPFATPPEEIDRRKANAKFLRRACNSHDRLLDALREIRDAETTCCPRCEGNGNLYADGKGHYMHENAPTINCGNCGGSGRLQPENAQEIAQAAISLAEKGTE